MAATPTSAAEALLAGPWRYEQECMPGASRALFFHSIPSTSPLTDFPIHSRTTLARAGSSPDLAALTDAVAAILGGGGGCDACERLDLPAAAPLPALVSAAWGVEDGPPGDPAPAPGPRLLIIARPAGTHPVAGPASAQAALAALAAPAGAAPATLLLLDLAPTATTLLSSAAASAWAGAASLGAVHMCGSTVELGAEAARAARLAVAGGAEAAAAPPSPCPPFQPRLSPPPLPPVPADPPALVPLKNAVRSAYLALVGQAPPTAAVEAAVASTLADAAGAAADAVCAGALPAGAVAVPASQLRALAAACAGAPLVTAVAAAAASLEAPRWAAPLIQRTPDAAVTGGREQRGAGAAAGALQAGPGSIAAALARQQQGRGRGRGRGRGGSAGQGPGPGRRASVSPPSGGLPPPPADPALWWAAPGVDVASTFEGVSPGHLYSVAGGGGEEGGG